MQDNDERLGTRHPIKPAVMGFPADKVACRMQTFESLNRLEEAGFVRLSLAVAGIFCASQKLHISAIYRKKSTTFCEVPLEMPPFTQSVRGCISGAVPLDVR
jgi:hypothetical protein